MRQLPNILVTLLALLLVSNANGANPSEWHDLQDEPQSGGMHHGTATALARDYPIVFTKHLGGGSALFGLDLATGTSAQLTPAGEASEYAVWSPTGDRVFFLGGKADQIDLMALDAATGEISTVIANMSEPVSASPDGTSLLVMQRGEEDHSLFLFNLADENMSPIDTGSSQDAYARWSGAGDAIAFESARDGNPEIYRHVISTGETMRLTENDHLDEWPSPSPNGNWIAWASGTEDEKHLWLMAADGSGKKQLTEDFLFGDAFPDWSPDGSQILLTVTEEDGPELVLVEVATGKIARLGAGFAATWHR